MSAVRAGFDVTAKSGHTTLLDRRHDLELVKAQVPGMDIPIDGAGSAEDRRAVHRI